MEASGSGEHEDKRLKLSFPEEKQIKWFETIEAYGSGEHEDTRWSFKEEIKEVLDRSVKLSFPEEEDIKWFESEEGQPHDYECLNVLTIWSKLRKSPELRRKYSHFEVPKGIGEVIMNNLLKFAGDMIQKPSIHDVGIVAFSLSRRWLAKSIHMMLKDGIDTWTPKLPVGRVMVDFPSLDEEINLGWFRQHAIANALRRMLYYSKVEEVAFWTSVDVPEFMSSLIPPLRREWGKSILIKQRDRDVVICVENKPPFILATRDLDHSDRDLKTLWLGIHHIKADWIVFLTPVRQQEYIEMCFTAAKLEGWMKSMEGKWNPCPVPGYPVLTYAGYRTYSTEELPNLFEQINVRCDWVALAEDARLLGYNDEAVVTCVLMYTCLKNHRLADCTFNSDEMVKEEGNTFVYLLHRRAEVHRITNNSREDIDELKKASDLILDKYEGWEEGEEPMLEFHLLAFTEVLFESSLFLLPHVMCEYLYDLSKKFKSYNDFVLRTGSVAETSRLLLCEATAVVMEKCFHLLGITPEVAFTMNLPLFKIAVERGLRSRSSANLPMDVCAPMAVEVGVEPQKLAEREQMDGTRLDPDFVNYFITPCFVSDARDPSRNSRFELMAIRPRITADAMFENGFLFGLILVSDKYGSVPDEGYFYYEPDFPYVLLFKHEWCDPVNIDRRLDGIVYPDNLRSHQVPFSSSIELRMELYASTEKKDDCFQLCDNDLIINMDNVWNEKSNGSCGYRGLQGADGRIEIYYMLLKDAVDAALEISFEMDTDREVHGEIFACYGDEFSYDCDSIEKYLYKAFLYTSFPATPGLIQTPVLERSGPIPLKKSLLAVPKNASLTIQAYFRDPETRDIILVSQCNFKTPTKDDSGKGFADDILYGKECRLKLKVVWK